MVNLGAGSPCPQNAMHPTGSIENFAQLRQLFPSADLVGNFTVFNISGNNYRLITYIDYQAQIIFIRDVLIHADYDKENWKNDNWFNNP